MSHEAPFLNRELGWLQFNQRVFFQAKDPRVPLLDRLRFLNIFHSNLDEFFMKRVGGLQRQFYANLASLSPDGLTPEEQLKLIREQVLTYSHEVRVVLTASLLPELAKHQVQLLTWGDLTETEKTWARQFFRDKVFSVLTPMAVDPGHPFPLISNLSTSLAISLKSPNEEESLFARIKIPEVFPTWIRIPNTPSGTERFISIVEIIKQHLDALFPRMTIQNVMPFRVTRNIDIETDLEEVEDLLELIEEEVKQRKFAEIVRLEHGPQPEPWLLEFLIDELDLTAEDVYEYPLPLEYKNLAEIANLPLPQHKSKQHTPVTSPQLSDESANIFHVIKGNDVLVHLPFESFATSIERFIVAASNDPSVIAIKMTLYRTNEDSPIVNALIRAAELGKQVVCLVELKARLDEERNIYWAQAMEKAGVHVVYGIVGLKTHCKLALIVRRERDEFRSYVYAGTGNFNSQTAKHYTDIGLLTARPDITSEVVEIFHYLTGRSLKTDYKSLLVAPINMKARFFEMIQTEIDNVKAGNPAGIVAKFNNLEDKGMIEALYDASKAGVPIELIVRGFCCLRPGVPGLSENIRVISIIGPFLEHSRIFYFRNGQAKAVDGRFFIGSADWMSRNLLARVEVIAPIEDKIGREKLWEILTVLRADQKLAWDMDGTGQYTLREPKSPEQEIGSHELLAEKTAHKAQQRKVEEAKSSPV